MTKKINPYYETEQFQNLFDELVNDSLESKRLDEKKGQNLEAFAQDLYSEPGHYIFELLQNAEDCKASEVVFSLRRDALIFSHNGPKFFSYEDIKAITTYGGGTKSLDSTKIGRFGIGFKSTSRICKTPKIRSDQFAFEIQMSTIPQEIEWNFTESSDNFSTEFFFQFEANKIKTEKIFEEVKVGLSLLESINLLFLNNINVVTIKFEDNSRKVLGRKQISEYLYLLRQSLDLAKKSVKNEYFLRFDHDLDNHELESWAEKSKLEVEKKNGPLKISLAFQADVSESSQKIERLKSVDDGKLFIFFPAKKEMTGLKFHIHAPFAATSTRESIKETEPVNLFLFEKFSTLATETLTKLINDKILNVESLEVFPNSGDEIRESLHAFQTSIYNFFLTNSESIPTSEGKYLSFENLREVNSDMNALFSYNDLNFISQFNSNIDHIKIDFYTKPKNSRAARFLSSLGIQSYGVKDLVVAFSYINSIFALNNQDLKKKFIDWYRKHEIDWFRELYIFLSNFDLSKIAVYFNKTPIIVVGESSFSFEIPSASYISRSGEKSGSKFVHPKILDFSFRSLMSSDDTTIWRFLEAIGVKQFSKSMELSDKLLNYNLKVKSIAVSKLKPGQELIDELNQILQFVHSDVELERALINEPIFLSEDFEGNLSWKRGKDLYLDQPYKPGTGLDSVMPKLSAVHKKFRLWNGYSSIPNIVLILDRLGVMVRVSAVGPGSAVVGEWEIPGLDEYLRSGSKLLRKNLWNYVKSATANRERHYLRFPNSYSNNSNQPSGLALKLRNSAWIPNRKGELKKPSQLDESSISKDYLIEKCDFLEMIQFGYETAAAEAQRRAQLEAKLKKDEAAKLFGVNDSAELEKLINAMKKDPKKMAKLVEEINRPIIGDHVSDPLALSEKARQVTADSPPIAMEPIEIRRRKGHEELTERRKHYLRSTYEEGKILSCQICSTSSFIKLTDQEAFFVGTLVIPSFSKNSIYNVIAVCAQCEAKFKYSRGTTDAQLKERIITTNDFSGIVKIQVKLANETEYINFKESHFSQLKGALSAE